MKRLWTDQELNKNWLLSQEELSLLKGKRHAGRLIFSVLLKHYQLTGYFPNDVSKVPESVIDFLSYQIGLYKISHKDLLIHERTMRDYCFEIRSFLNVKRFDGQASAELISWAIGSLFSTPDHQQIEDAVSIWFKENKFEKPSKRTLNRLLASAERSFEDQLFQKIYDRLSEKARANLEELLQGKDHLSAFSQLRKDTGSTSLVSVLESIARLNLLQAIDLPHNLLSGIPPRLTERYKRRASSDDVWELKRHPDVVRYALLSFYCVERKAEIIDILVELMISVVHKISLRSEKKVVSELVGEFTKVHGKTNLLFRIAEAVSDHPNDLVRDVIFPVVREEKIIELVKEYHSSGPSYVKKIYKRMRLVNSNAKVSASPGGGVIGR